MRTFLSLQEYLTNKAQVGMTEDFGIACSTNQKNELPDS